jgi:hypothetical protein
LKKKILNPQKPTKSANKKTQRIETQKNPQNLKPIKTQK